MSSDIVVRLSAEELNKFCNPQTMVGISLHVWKYFCDLFYDQAILIKKRKVGIQIRHSLEQISRYLQMVGDLSTETVDSVIVIYLKQLAFMSYKHDSSNKIINVTFHNMTVREVGILAADTIIDFLFDLALEVIVHIKSSPNKSPLDDCTIDYCWKSIAELEPMIRQCANDVHKSKPTVVRETYFSCVATMTMTHEPIPNELVKVKYGMDIYNIGQGSTIDELPVMHANY